MSTAGKVLILMGSDSDFAVMREAYDVLRGFGVEVDLRVLSVHRAPEAALGAASGAEAAGYRVIIAAAGQAAHLAGAVAAHTVLPVIGVPIDSGPLRGVDALYSTVMMPPGVPVAAMAIGGARNAAIFALEVLGVADAGLRQRLHAMKRELAEKVLEKDKKVQKELKG
jgi:phosphoribosylaminoimidazole carboxylase PurE protein